MDYREDISEAVKVMRQGGVIVYPTDTIWGIGCDARNSQAVKRVFEIKQRADSKALITLVGDEASLERTVEEVPDVAWQLIEASDRPTTIVYDKGIGVATELLGEDGSIAVRLTREPFSAQLCQRMRGPVVSTSANVSGQPSPARFSDIPQAILDAADYVCASRRNEAPQPVPSMIIKIGGSGLFKIIRS